MTQPLILFSKYVLTMDRPQPIEDAFVLIRDHQILQVGRRKDLYFLPSSRLLDLGDTVLMPGLINAHCHLDFTSFRGKVRYQGGFREWLRRMGARARETSPAEFRRSIELGIKESLDFGTTTLCDIATSGESFALLRQSGLRSFVFLEMIDLAQPSPKAYWKGFQQRLKQLLLTSPPTPTFRWGLSPHTPFTISKETLQLAGKYCAENRDLPTMLHLSESREEWNFFKTGKGPMAERIHALNPDWNLPRHTTPVQYLNHCGWLPKLDLGVHLNLWDEKDLMLLAKNRIAVVHCPGSHTYFAHPPFPYHGMKKHHIPVCLGTDSLASNRSLSLFREIGLFRKNHPQVGAWEALEMVTVKPAQALGLGHQLGRVKPGFLADLIGIPVPKGRFKFEDLGEHVTRYRGKVCFSMVHGELRLRLS